MKVLDPKKDGQEIIKVGNYQKCISVFGDAAIRSCLEN